MLFKIVITFFEEGPWLTPITETLEGRLWTHNFLPESQSDNKDLYVYKSVVTRCRGYTGACVGLANLIIWQRHFSSLKWDQITNAGIRWFRRRRYKYPQG